MVGVITHWDILTHPGVTVRCFGWRVFFRAVFSGRRKTFLSLLQEATAPATNVPSILDRCIGLELRARRMFAALSQALDDQGPVGPFFRRLAEQEQEHADLLAVCRAAAVRGGWRANLFNPWRDYLPRLEQQMEDAEAAVYEIDSVEAALRLVVRIESSEVNQVFHAALAATDADFVKKLRPFQQAMELHVSYIVDQIAELAPQLMMDLRELRAKFPQVRR